MDKRVLLAMSGGVDSSAAALILRGQGYEVAGATFLLRDPGPAPDTSAADAREVCDHLGIPHYTLDYRARFRRDVLDYFAAEYRRGATPNPCIACNRHIKFGSFVPDALAMGFDYAATGHYARVVRAGGRFHLGRGACPRKDQSYVLYTLTQEQLAHVLFPLGSMRKEEVRAAAREAGLSVSEKADSQDICFVPEGDYCAFLEAHTGTRAPEGDFVDSQGNVLGLHQGLWRYTVGQRKGLGLGFGRRVYVRAVNADDNTVVLDSDDSLFSREISARDLHLSARASGPFRCEAKIRYGARPASAGVFPLGEGRVRVKFDEPQRAAAPGQAVVFYRGGCVLGGATIV